MRKHAIYLYWLLLLAPTVLVGVAAFWALQREQDRFAESQLRAARDIATEKAGIFARRIRFRLELVQRELMQALTDIDDTDLTEQLAVWDREEPLVRNVFIWDPATGLNLPDPKRPESREQLSFIMRYEALFSGRVSWESTLAPEQLAGSQVNPALNESRNQEISLQQPQPPTSMSVKGGKEQQAEDTQQSLPVKGSKGQPAQPPQYRSANDRPQQILSVSNKRNVPYRQGWIAWFSGSRLHLLGWAQPHPDGRVRGVELETIALLSRLYDTDGTASREAPADAFHGYALIDDTGQVMYQEGAAADQPGAVTATVPVGSALPHWEVRGVYYPEYARTPVASRHIMLFGSLLIGVFLVAILTGGSLLLWQARCNALEAAQKTSFVANVSHELKTPLTSIRMYAELLGSGKVKDAGKQEKYLDIVVGESQRLGRLVNNVLDFSRLEQGRKKYHLEALPAAATMQQILEAQSPRINNAGLTITGPTGGTGIFLRADRDALEQILINLIDNACKYAAGGGDLTVELQAEPDACRISVMDRGPGVPSEHAARIFEKFHRADNSLTRQQDGVGLGLSITRRLARDMGGDLVYHPRAGGGASFVLTLPRAAAD